MDPHPRCRRRHFHTDDPDWSAFNPAAHPVLSPGSSISRCALSGIKAQPLNHAVTDRGHLATLDGMGGVAALAVVLLHGAGLTWVHMPGGYLAVDLFLVLSGLVIARAYRSRMSQLGTVGFLQIRLVRLYPLYLLGLLLGITAFGARAAQGGDTFRGLRQY